MAELKPGWQRVKLGDVVDVITDYWDRDSSRSERFVAGEHIDEGSLRVSRWGITDDDLVPPTFNRRFKAGDVLFHSRNLRKLARPDFGGITGEKIFILRTRDPRVLIQELLPFFLQAQTFSDYTERMWAGSTNKFLNKGPLVKYEFALPPLGDQIHISRALIAVERSLQCSTSASRLALDMSRRLLEAFNLTELPFAPVKDLLIGGPSNGVSPRCNDQGLGRPTLPVGCVYSGIVNTSSGLKYSQIDDSTFARYQLHKDDVLVVRGNGNRELVGRAGIVAEKDSQCLYPDLLIRLRFDSAKLSPDLAVLLWNCVPLHAALVMRAKSTNGIYKINGSDIREHCLPLPPAKLQLEMLEAIAIHAEALASLGGRVAAFSQIKSQLLKALVGIA